MTQEEQAKKEAEEKAAAGDKELTPEEKDKAELKKIGDDREDAVQKAIDDGKKAEAEYKDTIFKKYGYLLKTDVRCDGNLFPAGSRHKLSGVKKEQIERMLGRGDISK